ncbi:MAG: ATP phosphoribosyltransferase regulatory subunit [Christensenellales bacterium]
MDTYKKHVPDGMEDCLPEECYIKKNIENAIRKQFILSGYNEIETPTVEYYDVFQGGVGAYMQESMLKLVDSAGRILVLRPDLTVPIARVAATKLPEGEKRLFYIQNSFAAAEPLIGKAGEFTQAGIELIGKSGCPADAEVIALAVKTLRTAGLESFTIDIGQVKFFKALVKDIGIESDRLDELRHAVDSKNAQAIDAVAERAGIRADMKKKIEKLPFLFGGGEVFDKALTLADNEGCAKAVEELRGVFNLLAQYGLEKYISVDFGLLHDIAYYSGIVFRGIATGIGFPVVSGGRYDGLIERFGRTEPATGFALGIKRVMIAMERQGLLGGHCGADAVVACDSASAGKAFFYAESLRNSGKRTLFYTGTCEKELPELKQKTDCAVVIYFDADGKMKEF